MNMENKLFYSVPEVAALLGVQPSTVKKYIRTGRVSAGRVGGKAVITPKSLDDFLNGSKKPQGEPVEVKPRKLQRRGKRSGGATGAAAAKHAEKVKRESEKG